MDKPKNSNIDQDIFRIFEDFQEKAREVNPLLLSEIKSFNENHVALESYQNFISALNQPPLLNYSNHVSQ